MRNARTVTILLSSVILLLMFGCATPEQNTPDIVDVPYVPNNNVNGIYENEIIDAPHYENGNTYENNVIIDNHPAQTHEWSINENGFIEVIMPENLLGGGDAESAVRDFIYSIDVLYSLGIPVPMSDMIANPDGSVTILLTAEQLIQYIYNMRSSARIHEYPNSPSIVDVIFVDDEMLTEVTVLVYSHEFARNLLDRTASYVLFATFQCLWRN